MTNNLKKKLNKIIGNSKGDWRKYEKCKQAILNVVSLPEDYEETIKYVVKKGNY